MFEKAKEGTKKNNKQPSGDLANGNPWKVIIIFALPILFGSLLQQLYNAIDAVVVGHFVGSNALGAVGSTGAIVQLLVALFMGLSSGACVVAAHYFGKKDKESLSKTVHTAMLLAVLVGVIVSIAGIFISPYLLKLTDTPPEMLKDATTYLQIFFGGTVALSVYNMGAALLQAVGNSKYPLYFLIVTTVLNVILDLLFVIVFKMGVAGAAVATIIAELVSAMLVLLVFMKTKNEYKMNFKKLKFDKLMTKRIFAIGLPGTIQNSIVSASNIMVLSYINSLGATAVAGYAAQNKLDAFLPLPISSLALAITPYVSQNLGAAQEKRAREGVWIAVLLGACTTAVLSLFVFFFHNLVLSAFSSDPEVLKSAWQFGIVVVPFYVVLSLTQILTGALRGASKVKFTTIVSILCYVVIRQIYLAIVTKTHHTLLTVSLGYSITWITCAAIVLIYYLAKKHISCEHATRIHINHTDGTNVDFLELCKKLDDFQNESVPGRREVGLSSVYNIENLKDIFLLYDGTTVVGSAALWRHDDETCELIRMFVDPAHYRKDYIKMLISRVEDFAKNLGYKNIHLRTFRSQDETLTTYQELGFLQLDPTDFKYVDKYPPAMSLAPLRVYMRREIL